MSYKEGTEFSFSLPVKWQRLLMNYLADTPTITRREFLIFSVSVIHKVRCA